MMKPTLTSIHASKHSLGLRPSWRMSKNILKNPDVPVIITDKFPKKFNKFLKQRREIPRFNIRGYLHAEKLCTRASGSHGPTVLWCGQRSRVLCWGTHTTPQHTTLLESRGESHRGRKHTLKKNWGKKKRTEGSSTIISNKGYPWISSVCLHRAESTTCVVFTYSSWSRGCLIPMLQRRKQRSY